MTLTFYISGHGFGHASRSLEVIAAVRERQPTARITVRSSVPRWFLDAAGLVDVEIEHVEVDVGMAQLDSLRIDLPETARRAALFYRDFDLRAESEAGVLRQTGTTVVAGDIPPLAFAAAAKAGLPSIAFGNFTWDWIYENDARFVQLAPGVVETIRGAYASTTLALRLPFHGGFAPMADRVRDLPLVARRASHSRDTVRQLLELDAGRPVVLASFGGHGLRLPYEAIARGGQFTLVLTDFEDGSDQAIPGLARLSTAHLRAQGLRYADLVAACDVVVTKPGYGIVSECIANGASLLYTSRGHFAEHDVFVAEMPAALRCHHIPPEDLLSGRWAQAIEALLGQPAVSTNTALNGAAVAAEVILKNC